jgi:hypothetical protein
MLMAEQLIEMGNLSAHHNLVRISPPSMKMTN